MPEQDLLTKLADMPASDRQRLINQMTTICDDLNANEQAKEEEEVKSRDHDDARAKWKETLNTKIYLEECIAAMLHYLGWTNAPEYAELLLLPMHKIIDKVDAVLDEEEWAANNETTSETVEQMRSRFTQSRDWHIWSEGFRATGQEGLATYHGLETAPTFIQACQKKFGTEDKDFYLVNGIPYYWRCRLFDNEEDARRTYG